MIISQTVPSFWESYRELPDAVRKAAQKAFEIWKENPLGILFTNFLVTV